MSNRDRAGCTAAPPPATLAGLPEMRFSFPQADREVQWSREVMFRRSLVELVAAAASWRRSA